MTDFKVSIKIEWSGMGVSKKTDMWINYAPGDDDIDERVKEWLQETYREAYAKYSAGAEISLEVSQEATDRAEYERLKAKFG